MTVVEVPVCGGAAEVDVHHGYARSHRPEGQCQVKPLSVYAHAASPREGWSYGVYNCAGLSTFSWRLRNRQFICSWLDGL